MTGAELTAAADRLDTAATAARHDLENDDYWTCYDPATAWRDGFVNGFGGPTSELAALFHPDVATELARWLRREARDATPSQHALALARAVNTQETT